ncbi:MAG: histidine kinase [Bacteroidales bacterium]|nr:histidine kinase [Bacteroidales bacterium]
MKAFRLIILFLVMMPGISQATTAFLSDASNIRIKIPRDLPEDTAKINSLTRTGIKYLSKPLMIKEAKACIDTALFICKKEKIEIPALLHLLMAEYNLTASDYQNASAEAALAMEQAEESGEYEVLAKTMFFLGGYYEKAGFYKESLDNYASGIALSKDKGLKGFIQKGYEGQAHVHNTINNLEGYEQSLKSMIEASMTENDTGSLALGYFNLGSLNIEKSRNYELADSLLKRSLVLSLAIKDTFCITRVLANMGYNFYLSKKYDSALSYYNKSLKYGIPGRDFEIVSNAYGNLGTIYRDMGDQEKSIKNYTMGIEYAKKVDDWYDLYWIYSDMSKMYLKARDTSNAFKNYVLFKKYSDSTLIKNRNKWFSDASTKYKVDTQQKEVELLSLRLKNQRLLNYGFIGFFILAIAIGLLLWRGTQLKAKRRISEMNQKISEITQANLRQQMNPHFIFNTLNSIQYYMYQHDKLATNNYLTKFSNLMRKVLENSQHTSVTLRDELNALNLYLELECIRFKDKFDYEIKVDEEIDPLIYKVPTMLIQPYVENSICHGLMPREGKGTVRIDIKLNQNHLLCTIEDNGIGREAAHERRVKKENNHNSLGTQITTSRLDLVNALYGTSLKTTYTDLKNINGDPTGTRVEINIPLLT